MSIHTLSVCIATHERPQLLERTLDGLAKQVRQPGEIIVSDSSSSQDSEAIVRSFALAHPNLITKYVASDMKALPWQRWLAFTYSVGDRVLFIDDDVRLTPSALQILETVWLSLNGSAGQHVAGVGFSMAWDGGEMLTRDRTSLKERWLGTSNVQSGTVTSGGLSVSMDDLRSNLPIRVDQLWGGAMSFSRQVLESIGPLDNLVALYDKRVGRGEDVVLSFHARKHGDLYLITQPVALHPRYGVVAEGAPYAHEGWHLGLTATWGRAHTLRWVASDWLAYKRAWVRIATLELARSFVGIVKRPQKGSSWKRLAGACYGTLHTIASWNSIPFSATSTMQPKKITAAQSRHLMMESD